MERDICLNIHYSAPKEVWKMINEVYRSMGYWYGIENGCPTWKGDGTELCASVEPSGIQISGEMPDDMWKRWYGELTSKLTEKLGYPIGEPEDGYKFKYWEPFKKNYADIKTIDSKMIVFKDYATFFFEDFTEFKSEFSAECPRFVLSSELMELRIDFVSENSKKDMQDFCCELKRLGLTITE